MSTHLDIQVESYDFPTYITLLSTFSWYEVDQRVREVNEKVRSVGLLIGNKGTLSG